MIFTEGEVLTIKSLIEDWICRSSCTEINNLIDLGIKVGIDNIKLNGFERDNSYFERN